MGTAIKHSVQHSVPDRICDLQMTDGLTQSGTECFIAVLMWQQWASKG